MGWALVAGDSEETAVGQLDQLALDPARVDRHGVRPGAEVVGEAQLDDRVGGERAVHLLAAPVRRQHVPAAEPPDAPWHHGIGDGDHRVGPRSVTGGAGAPGAFGLETARIRAKLHEEELEPLAWPVYRKTRLTQVGP